MLEHLGWGWRLDEGEGAIESIVVRACLDDIMKCCPSFKEADGSKCVLSASRR